MAGGPQPGRQPPAGGQFKVLSRSTTEKGLKWTKKVENGSKKVFWPAFGYVQHWKLVEIHNKGGCPVLTLSLISTKPSSSTENNIFCLSILQEAWLLIAKCFLASAVFCVQFDIGLKSGIKKLIMAYIKATLFYTYIFGGFIYENNLALWELIMFVFLCSLRVYWKNVLFVELKILFPLPFAWENVTTQRNATHQYLVNLSFYLSLLLSPSLCRCFSLSLSPSLFAHTRDHLSSFNSLYLSNVPIYSNFSI